MGVAGVAWATFICQGISCILALAVVLLRLKTVKTSGKIKVFSIKQLKDIAVIAIPSILQQSFISVGNIIIQGVINTFGSSVIAGYSASVKLNNLVITSFTTIGNGISNYTAQNIGANKLPRIKEGFKAGLKIVWIICVPLIILYFFAGKYFVYLFLDEPSAVAMKTATQFLKIISPFYFVASSKLVADGILRGAGKMKAFMTATFTDLILRVVLAVILSAPLGTVGIWLAWPIGWIIGAGLSVFFCSKGEWNKAKI